MSLDPRVGTELAGYRIESVIGRGGMGVVYLAEHLRLKRKVALKVLAPELAADERFRDRFMRESEIAASLDHPNVVTIHDAGEADGLLYLAMRYVQGRDLKTLIEQEGALAPDRVVSLIGQVASALDAAHTSGLIHRDVKSANILVTPGSMGHDQAYLTDFGLTKRPESVSGLTKTGQFLGSVEYAAPEQFEGKPLDARTDVYSLGCVLFECLTGRVPFERESEASVMYAHLRDQTPKPTVVRPELPAGFDAVVSKAMAKAPGDRFARAGDLAMAAAEANAPAQIVQPTRKKSRRRIVILAGASLVLIAATIAVVFAVGNGKDGTPPPVTGGGTPLPAIVRIDPATNRVVARIPQSGLHQITFARGLISIGERVVWVSDGTNRVFKINADSNRLVSTISSSVGNGGLVAAFDALWILGPRTPNTGKISRIDPTTNRQTGEVDVSLPCCTARLAAGDGVLWALSGGLYRIDPETLKGKRVSGRSGQALAVGEGALWVLDVVASTLVEVDPGTGRDVDSTALAGSPLALAVGEGAVWIIDDEGEQVIKIPVSGTGGIENIKVGSRPSSIAVGEGAVWVVNRGDQSVSKIDPIGGSVTSIKVGSEIDEIAVGEGAVWVK
jgi:serine/threonine protein kinase